MSKRTKLIVGAVAAILALGALAGFTIAADSEEPLTGSTYDRATEAALDHVDGGEVVETESGDGGAAYGVEIRRDDGSVVEVELDENYKVIGTEADDDGPNGDDEGADDDD
jgi:hypothetical protein